MISPFLEVSKGMRLFNKTFSFALVAIGLPLLFLPKINLLSFGDRETAGIRIDDACLLLLFFVIGWAHFALHKRMSAIERWMGAIVAFSLISFALNKFFVSEGWLHVNASIFYCLRLAEYFVFFYIGAMSIKFFRTSPIIATFFLWNLALMLLQRAGLVGQFTFEGYSQSDTSRVVGIGSFPSETGMFINLVFCFLVYSDEKRQFLIKFFPQNFRAFLSHTYVYWLFLICSTLVIITGSRIAIIALLVTFLFRIKRDLSQKSVASWLFALTFISIGVVSSTFLILNNEAIVDRSAGLLSMNNIDLIELVWDKIDLKYDPIGNEAVKYGSYDMSWWMRIHKWVYALKIYYLHPECWLQGVGPGFAMAALDGGYIRILTEYGLIGCFLFWKLFSTIAKQSLQMHWIVIAFAINMIFFDVYLAYKPMSLLFFISGCTWARERAAAAEQPCLA